MKERYKKYLKINIVPIIFITVSFIFTTFAWFSYSGLRKLSTEIDVKAWYIELTKSGDVVSNDIVITLNDVYPGMETVHEVVNIENKGDSDAQLSYKIVSARILDNTLDGNILENDNYLSDALAHEYPFHVNIDLSKNYILANNDSSTFEVSVSWPLDSGNDNLDSVWGMNAYDFQKNENNKLTLDKTYNVRPAIQIVISITAEQYIENDNSSDVKYNLGDNILYDVKLNHRCFNLSDTCINTTVIDVNNKIGEENVTLLPSLYEDFGESTFNDYETKFELITTNWTAPRRPLIVDDLLHIISKDVINSVMNGDNISPQIIGNLTYNNRITKELESVSKFNGYYTFMNDRFNYLVKSGCYWTNSSYDSNNGFAFGKLNDLKGEIYGKNKNELCKIVPVILAPKDNL